MYMRAHTYAWAYMCIHACVYAYAFMYAHFQTSTPRAENDTSGETKRGSCMQTYREKNTIQTNHVYTCAHTDKYTNNIIANTHTHTHCAHMHTTYT